MSVHLKDFVVGQKAYISGKYREKEPIECTVKTVGRKYVTVSCYTWDSIRYEESFCHLDSLQENTKYGASSLLYRTLDDYNSAINNSKLKRWIEYELPKKNLTYEQLKSVKELVDSFDCEK